MSYSITLQCTCTCTAFKCSMMLMHFCFDVYHSIHVYTCTYKSKCACTNIVHELFLIILYLGIDTSDLSWLSESVPQAALLTVQSKWTPIITSAFDNTQMIDSARYNMYFCGH